MRILLPLLIGFLFLIAFVRYIESTSIFYPSRKVTYTPKDINLSFEDIHFKTEDNITLHGWLIKFPSAKSTLIFFHGNAGNIGDRLEKITMFHQMGINVFIVDYRGYGKSEGSPSEEGVYKDALAAFDYLLSCPDINQDKIVVYGASLGGVVAVDLASKRKVAALIIDSSFPTAADISRAVYPMIPTFLLKTKMDSASKVRVIVSPKLFIHSVEDEIVPFKLGRKLFEAAREPKEFLAVEGYHNTIHLDSKDKFKDGIRNFLKGLNLI